MLLWSCNHNCHSDIAAHKKEYCKLIFLRLDSCKVTRSSDQAEAKYFSPKEHFSARTTEQQSHHSMFLSTVDKANEWVVESKIYHNTSMKSINIVVVIIIRKTRTQGDMTTMKMI